MLARATAGSTTRNTGETRLTLTNKQRISTAARQLAVPENPVAPAVRVVLAVPENPADLAARVVLVAPENPADLAVRVALAALENPVVPAALAVLENPAARVALAVLENPVVPAALGVLENPVVLAALVNRVVVVEKEAQTRSVAISRRRAAAAAGMPLRAGVAALLKPRAAEVAVA